MTLETFTIIFSVTMGSLYVYGLRHRDESFWRGFTDPLMLGHGGQQDL